MSKHNKKQWNWVQYKKECTSGGIVLVHHVSSKKFRISFVYFGPKSLAWWNPQAWNWHLHTTWNEWQLCTLIWIQYLPCWLHSAATSASLLCHLILSSQIVTVTKPTASPAEITNCSIIIAILTIQSHVSVHHDTLIPKYEDAL